MHTVKMQTEMLKRVPIFNTAYKNANLVKRCADSFVSVYGEHLPEMVIVDDTVGDVLTQEIAESYTGYCCKFTVVPQNGGCAGVNNFGYPLCTNEFIVLVNSDNVFREYVKRFGLPFGDMIRSGGE